MTAPSSAALAGRARALAHRNADGCRHLRRYQDAEELLKAGIDVYATLSVQHIESLGDIVASITGEPEPERIPDSGLTAPIRWQWWDIEPEELLKRQSRKTSFDAVNTRARTLPLEKLIALRELALRRAAVR